MPVDKVAQPRGIVVMAIPSPVMDFCNGKWAAVFLCPMAENTNTMLINKLIGITDETVSKETDIIKLIEWRNTTQNQVIDIKRRLQDLADPQNHRRATDAKSYLVQLLNVIEHRINTVRKEQGMEVLLMRKFMKVAKKELGKAVYNQILDKAKVLAGYNNKAESGTADSTGMQKNITL